MLRGPPPTPPSSPCGPPLSDGGPSAALVVGDVCDLCASSVSDMRVEVAVKATGDAGDMLSHVGDATWNLFGQMDTGASFSGFLPQYLLKSSLEDMCIGFEREKC